MSYFVRLGVVSTLFMGPFGFFGTLFAAVLAIVGSKKNVSAAYIDKILKKRDEKRDPAVLLAKLNYKKTERVADKLDILSYKELLATGDEFAKINLIGMLSFNPSKENVSIVRGALNDTEETVRILAATSLQKMDAAFVSKILELKELESGAEGFGAEEAQSYFGALGEVYDDYLYSGLIAKENERFYIASMLSCYKKAFEAKGVDRDMRRYIRALIRFNRLDEAQRLCEEYADKNGVDEAMRFWMGEIAYKKRDIEGLKTIFGGIDKNNLSFEPYKKSYGWWMDEG